MSSNIPVLKPQEVAKILEKLGFIKVRQKGSHQQFRIELTIEEFLESR